MKPYAVLGSGPAGLMAAYALYRHGKQFVILSSGGKSRMGGAQFLHKPIPGITDFEGTALQYVLRGSAARYQAKVYGANEVPFVSFSRVSSGEVVRAWSLIQAYDKIWNVFHDNVELNHTVITPKWLGDHRDDFRAIFTTVPLDRLCRARAGLTRDVHDFTVQTIRILPDTLEEIPNNTILYDGTEDRTWYRSSRIFGVGGTEWSINAKTPPGLSPIFEDKKPIQTNCDCWTDNSGPPVVRLGRRGKWKKGELTHDAFHGALSALAEMGAL